MPAALPGQHARALCRLVCRALYRTAEVVHMGRTIPSITYRLESKFQQWEKFGKLLSGSERAAFQKLVAVAKNRRTAIAEADEPDLGVAIPLAIATHLAASMGDELG